MELNDEYFMRKALQQAEQAASEEEVPIGAIVAIDGHIIGKGYNQSERLHDVTAHAEILAITAASGYLSSKFLNECTLYVTVEPCAMCAGAIAHARIPKVVFGAPEPKSGYRKFSPDILERSEVITGVLQNECANLMLDFFRAKRN